MAETKRQDQDGFKEALLSMPDVGDDVIFQRDRDVGRPVEL